MEESPLQNYKARQTALLGMLFALSMALSFLESMLTPFFGLMPAMKLGLSNIVVMYAVLFLNRRSALYLVLLKNNGLFLVFSFMSRTRRSLF